MNYIIYLAQCHSESLPARERGLKNICAPSRVIAPSRNGAYQIERTGYCVIRSSGVRMTIP